MDRDFPRLVTPQWIGDPEIEAVVVLAIDDMRDPARYEAYLRPILDRLNQVQGQASMSIMTNRVDPQDPQLQAWLREGVNVDVLVGVGVGVDVWVGVGVNVGLGTAVVGIITFTVGVGVRVSVKVWVGVNVMVGVGDKMIGVQVGRLGTYSSCPARISME